MTDARWQITEQILNDKRKHNRGTGMLQFEGRNGLHPGNPPRVLSGGISIIRAHAGNSSITTFAVFEPNIRIYNNLLKMKLSISYYIILNKIFIITFLLGCNKSSSETTKSEISNIEILTIDDNEDIDVDNINIHFVDKPEFDSELITNTKHNRGRLDYITIYDNYERSGYRFDDVSKNKVINYSTQSSWVMIRQYLSFFEFRDFLVHKGDSLIMSFDRNKPIKIKYSKVKYAPQDFNVEIIIEKKYPNANLTTGMADDTRNVAYKYFFDDPRESKMQLARKGFEKGSYLEDLENKMGSNLLNTINALKNDNQYILDSLYDSKQISSNIYSFYKQKYSNLLLKIEMMSDLIDSTQAADKLNNRFRNEKFQSEYFYQCLDKFENKYIASKAKWTVSNQYNLRDPRESFAIAANSSILDSLVKDQLLLISLNKINLYFPDEVTTYLRSFTSSIKDTSLIQIAEAKFGKDELINESLSDLHLLNFNREQITIEKILENNRGKIIYIDFWASWCAPCIEEMGYTKSLIQLYKNKEFEVLFLSLDDNYMKWNKSSEKLEINIFNNSFKILKPENSKFIQKYNIKSIPRYMIIDKNGKIINTNASRPSDPKTKKLLYELLNE